MPQKACYNCFKMLSDRNRVLIISLLQKGEKTVSQLLKKFKITQPTISHHLARLKKYNLVKTEKRGREVFYSLDKRFVCPNCKIFDKLKL